MPILDSELQIYKASSNNDLAGNGGVMSANQSLTGVVGNLFPRVSAAERSSGITRFRKGFFKVHSGSDLTAFNVQVFMSQQTPADDIVTFFIGTQDDIQSDVEAAGVTSYTHHGNGILKTTITGGATTSFDVLVEDASSIEIFQNGAKIRVSDKTSLGDTGGSEDFVTISTVSFVGNTATINVTAAPANSYVVDVTTVSTVHEVAELKATVTLDSVTTAGSGDVDGAQLVNHAIGGVFDTFTFTFTSSTAYNCVGARLGSLGSGSISSDFSPNNPDFANPYFTIPSAAFSGVFATNDTFVITTNPQAIPIWFYQVVPAGANSVTGNSLKTQFLAESE